MSVAAIAWKRASRTPGGRSFAAMGMPGVTKTSQFNRLLRVISVRGDAERE
jgi:hypothetical protein